MAYLSTVNGLHIDVVRTFFCAESAVVAGIVIFCHVEDLELWFRVEHLQKITREAESSQKHCPRNICSEHVSHIVSSEKHTDPYPEFESVGNRSQRTEIAAPEHIDKEASQYYHTDGYDRHPECYLSLESCSDCVIRIEVLAEKLARIYSHIEDPEYEGVFHDTQNLVDG